MNLRMRKKQMQINFASLLPRLIIFTILSLLLIVVLKFDGKPIIKLINDSDFQISRTLSLETVFKSPVNFKLFNHNGTLTSILAPWLFIYPLYLLIVICQNVIWGYYLYFILLTIITLEITYRCIYLITKRVDISYLASILYSFATYRLLDIYFRIDISEVVMMTFLPILLVGIYQLLYSPKINYKAFVIGFVGLIYSDSSAFIVGLLFTIVVLIIRACMRSIHKEQFIVLIKASMWIILLSAAYVIPAMQVYLKTSITKIDNGSLLQSAIPLQNLILNSINSYYGQDKVLPGLGIVLFVIFIVMIIGIYKLPKGFIFEMSITTIILFVMITPIFPWELFQKYFDILEFPWRLLSIVSLLIAFSGAYALLNIFTQSSKKVMIGTILAVALLQVASLSSLYYLNGKENYVDNEHYINLYDRYDYAGIKNYIPERVADHYQDFINHRGEIDGVLDILNPEVSDDGTVLTFNVTSAKNKGVAKLPVYGYPGEHVEVNGQQLENIKQTEDGYLKVPLEYGSNNIKVSYSYTLLAKVSFIVSILSLILFIISILRKQPKGRIG